jgi:hypothetical protein
MPLYYTKGLIGKFAPDEIRYRPIFQFMSPEQFRQSYPNAVEEHEVLTEKKLHKLVDDLFGFAVESNTTNTNLWDSPAKKSDSLFNDIL